MSVCKYTYDSLNNKYQGFKVPCIDIEIDGKKIKTLLADKNEKNKAIKIESIKISLSMEKSSMAQIKVSDVYDYVEGSMADVVKLGSAIRIMLGYGSSSEDVFYGYIAEVDYEFKGSFNIVITAFDVLNLMEQQSCPQYYISKSYSDIVKSIISGYSTLIKKKNLDSLDINREFVCREERVSDLQFIKRLCGECGKMFYMFAGELFIKDKFDEKPIVNLDIHQLMKSFKFSKRYKNSEVKVIGFDNQKHDEEISGKCSIKISGYADATVSPQVKVVTVPEISNSADAGKYAENICNDIMKKVNTGVIYCTGLPEIKTGGCVTVSGIEKSTFDTYRMNVSEVVHTINDNGFNTIVTINGWS